jgi:predicted DNA-binding ArsR family transcriptional regulator
MHTIWTKVVPQLFQDLVSGWATQETIPAGQNDSRRSVLNASRKDKQEAQMPSPLSSEPRPLTKNLQVWLTEHDNVEGDPIAVSRLSFTLTPFHHNSDMFD